MRFEGIVILGIVGHEAAKFDAAHERIARRLIRRIIMIEDPEAVCSGECHLGGIDVWTREATLALGKPFIPYAPATNEWETGFKPRNIQIAEVSYKVVCIVVALLPRNFHGRRFADCYHCLGRNPPHVKSGGCWTAWHADGLGREAEWRIV